MGQIWRGYYCAAADRSQNTTRDWTWHTLYHFHDAIARSQSHCLIELFARDLPGPPSEQRHCKDLISFANNVKVECIECSSRHWYPLQHDFIICLEEHIVFNYAAPKRTHYLFGRRTQVYFVTAKITRAIDTGKNDMMVDVKILEGKLKYLGF